MRRLATAMGILLVGPALLGGAAPARDRPQPSLPAWAVSTVSTGASTPGASRPGSASLRPRIRGRPIPYGRRRRAEMASYARRHYGLRSYRLTRPRVIVEHYTETSSFRAAYDTFAPDRPDSELRELPGVCAHFVVDRDGSIYQLVAVGIMCRHTVGLNYTALGIEHVGHSDGEILRNPRELRASLALTRWLRCRFDIAVRDVIGHNESLSSPYHRERVARLRHQTHDDWKHSDMRRYRARLRRLSCH